MIDIVDNDNDCYCYWIMRLNYEMYQQNTKDNNKTIMIMLWTIQTKIPWSKFYVDNDNDCYCYWMMRLNYEMYQQLRWIFYSRVLDLLFCRSSFQGDSLYIIDLYFNMLFWWSSRYMLFILLLLLLLIMIMNELIINVLLQWSHRYMYYLCYW